MNLENKLTITDNALRYISEMKEELGLPVKGLRVRAVPYSPLRAEFALSFVPTEELESASDTIHATDNLDIYINPETALYIDGAIIDLEFKIVGSELKIVAPLRKLDSPDSHIAAKIHQVLTEQVNPALVIHGGAAALIDVMNKIAYIELKGGCQGCSMADATMKNSIEKTIRESVPEVLELRDVTDHLRGLNPFFQ